MGEVREISNVQEYQTKVWDHFSSKKTHLLMTFSFWGNDIFAKKQAFFDIFGQMKYHTCRPNYQNGYVVHHYQKCT